MPRTKTTNRAAATRVACAVSLSPDELVQLREDAARVGLTSAPELLRHLWQSWRAGDVQVDREGLRTRTAELRRHLATITDAIDDAHQALDRAETAAGLVTDTGARVDE